MVARPVARMSPEARALASDPAHVAQARRLARRAARGFPRLRDELEGAALHGLCLSARSFDPARGVPFSALLHLRVVGMLRNELRAWRRFARLALRASLDGVPDPGEGPDDLDAPDFEALLAPLPGPHRDVIRLRFAGGLGRPATAATLGRCFSTVRLHERMALESIRARLSPPAGTRPADADTRR